MQHASEEVAADSLQKGILDCVICLPKEQEAFSLQKGTVVSVNRYFLAEVLHFAFDDDQKQVFLGRGGKYTQHRRYFAGSMIPCEAAVPVTLSVPSYFPEPIWQLMWENLTSKQNLKAKVVSYPLDTMSQWLMLQCGHKGADIVYTWTLDCWRKISKDAGRKAFLQVNYPIFSEIGWSLFQCSETPFEQVMGGLQGQLPTQHQTILGNEQGV